MTTLDLAVIGNCAIASLIDRNARHNWFCFPRLDGDPVFCALVDGNEPTRGFMDVVVRDAVAIEPALSAQHGGVGDDDHRPQRRPGAHYRFRAAFQRYGRSFRPPMLVRRLEPLAKRVRLAVRIRPVFNYGADKPAVSVGSNHLRYGGPHTTLRVTADMATAYILEEAEFALDRPVNLFIGADESVPENPDALAQSFLAQTIEDWRTWVRGLSVPFEWQSEVIRSAITLKLCSCEDTGAIVAALTTSIPEAPNSARNWDYRFCWLRDAFFTVGALNRLGATRTMEGFIRFVIDAVLREDDVLIAPLYPISTATSSAERLAPALSRLSGNGPGAHRQCRRLAGAERRLRLDHPDRRADVLGRAPDPRRRCNSLPAIARHGTARGALCRHARRRTLGISRPRQRTYLFGGDVLGGAAPAGFDCRTRRRKRRRRGVGWAGSQAAQRAHRPRDDAGRLAFRRARRARSPTPPACCCRRSASCRPTIRASPRRSTSCAKRLVRDGFVMRYDEADDFGHPETAFLVCTFWYVDALALAGRRDEAREIFKRVLAVRNAAGLLSEDILPQSGALWGNFPQAYSHVGLIHSAARLSRGWEEALWRAS